ncbi:TMEM165/GDT1 family protein [Acidaminobacter hydrogenoformans]|uniref:GDT1 family protein n=1 Tax=Acidaminobacter hydrogenoformans DSM 2784 TaxID=1120920 RepID=A0A1G5S7T2_9FIRM|nr:TMEM165/GDT1 family protein [Acidaminobacter hydrogenoformans]SCZ81679.1 Putative Ca2+/H+ antiporter, TMEM165/GDT1 family [Acidaminobacter hydrogenoformans DSM 2784]
MFAEYFQALALIFIAEMGDKTQILSMAFATKFKIRQILIGVALGAALNHGLAIAFGTLLSRYVPLELLQLVAGVLFLFFAFWSLQAQEAEEEDVKSAYGPVLTVALAFFLGELGDKTQLTALTLSAGAKSPVMVLAGTVSGMVLTSLIGILVGIKLGDKIKELHLKLGAFSVFMFFGLQKIFTSPLTGSWSWLVWIPLLAALAVLSYFRITGFRRALSMIEKTQFQARLEDLRAFAGTLRNEVEMLCKGEVSCSTCIGEACLVGYMKKILDQAAHHVEIDKSGLRNVEQLLDRSYDKQKARGILNMINRFYAEYPESFGGHGHDAFESVRLSIERIVFGAPLGEFDKYQDYKHAIEAKDSSFGLKKL